MSKRFTTIIEREDDTYVALCPELEIVSQGQTPSHARKNLREALDLFRECASPAELRDRLQPRTFLRN